MPPPLPAHSPLIVPLASMSPLIVPLASMSPLIVPLASMSPLTVPLASMSPLTVSLASNPCSSAPTSDVSHAPAPQVTLTCLSHDGRSLASIESRSDAELRQNATLKMWHWMADGQVRPALSVTRPVRSPAEFAEHC